MRIDGELRENECDEERGWLRWIKGMVEMVVRIVFAIGRKKVGAGWGTRGKTGFSNKSEACKKRCPGRAEAPLL